MAEAADPNLWDGTRSHYNSHVTDLSTHEAIKQRNEGPAKALKDFHNHIKRQLLLRFSTADGLVGWTQVKYVKGLDISEREVDEARRRFAEMVEPRRGGPGLQCEFEAVDWLGAKPYVDGALGPSAYGVVSCMFALHYFFVTEASLRTFLGNVASNLRQGGYFLGTIPSGHRVQELLNGKPELRTPMLKLKRRWRDARPAVYGSGYICDIADTVTSSLEGATEGSLEYLVDLPTLERVAAETGLFPVRDYMDPVLAGCFEQDDIDAPFKRFKPFFLHSLQLDVDPRHNPHPMPPSSLEKASSLFVAFVFQKAPGPEAVTVPIAPECSYMKPPEPPRRPQPQGWPEEGHGPGPHGPMGHMGQPPFHGPPDFHGGPMGHPGMGGPMGPPGQGGGYGNGPPPYGHGPPGGKRQGDPGMFGHGGYGAEPPGKKQRGWPGGGAGAYG
ncbi:hypothetical protein GPECTOR_7g929 [Gonium pectorale]|uniref:mRNA (guanine-N(7))-methyltransferase n=1 Tax=Gonium pectorale TaxID=33097 RepID=A0A150GUG5_GONPE|nr:hypothetical protein GPECTOR_7g929 [Gonium pectorale]|eukprot:KXZ53479.1 hypothetical protein GPECTOR_7g929 [Gonium pectorale]